MPQGGEAARMLLCDSRCYRHLDIIASADLWKIDLERRASLRGDRED